MGVTYTSCANAADMVDWLVTQPYCGSRADAVQICLDLQKQVDNHGCLQCTCRYVQTQKHGAICHA